MHSAGFILPPERGVDCDCSPELYRPVMHDPTGWNLRVTACLCCGTVTVTESMVEEPRPHDVRLLGNRICAVEPEVLAWLGEWPRFAWSVYEKDRNIYLPAALRCASEKELLEAEQSALGALAGILVGDRRKIVGCPAKPPPKTLPSYLSHFARVWKDLA